MSIILKFDQASEQIINMICRIVGFIKLRNLVPLLNAVELESNPRSAKVGPITDAISDSLDTTPSSFAAKTKGILVGTSNYKSLERRRYQLTFENLMLEGILDGGHNALALGIRILRIVGVKDKDIRRIRRWSDFKTVWNGNYNVIERTITKSLNEDLDILIPVELLVPTNPDDISCVEDFSAALLDICAARNNNAQLKAETKANQKGYFEVFKKYLPTEISEKVEWKTNDGGNIKVADLIALSWVPMALIDFPIGEDGRRTDAPVSQNIYRSKGDCITHFEKLMSSPSITKASADGYRRELNSEAVESAIRITIDILRLYDEIYRRLPESYNMNNGNFSRITAVKKMNSGNSTHQKYTKFTSMPVGLSIPDGFIIPLVVGLRSLMHLGVNGAVEWRTDPIDFLNNHFNTVVKDYKVAISLLDYDPQKVGKSPESYRMAEVAYEMVLLRSGK